VGGGAICSPVLEPCSVMPGFCPVKRGASSSFVKLPHHCHSCTLPYRPLFFVLVNK